MPQQNIEKQMEKYKELRAVTEYAGDKLKEQPSPEEESSKMLPPEERSAESRRSRIKR